MTSRYRANRELILATAYQSQNILALSETFDRTAIDKLLAQPGCEKLRIYFGMDEDLKVHTVLVAADENNADILPSSTTETEGDGDDDDIIIDNGNRCPPLCPPTSPLNEP